MAGICGMFPGMGVAKKIKKEQEWKMLGGKSQNGMKKEKQKGKHSGLAAEIIFYFLVFAAITCFAVIQTYGDPPDEINRFKVVKYIYNHGILPHGADPEVILAGYGASYAFQPMLTYIIQGVFFPVFAGSFSHLPAHQTPWHLVLRPFL